MFKKFLKVFFVIILLFFVYSFGVVVGENQGNRSSRNGGGGEIVNTKELPKYLSSDVDASLFWEVRDIIQKYYVDGPVPETELFYGALAGQVASLGDPYSVFLDPEIAEKFAKELSSEFDGIGAEIGIKKGILTVVSPLSESPAERAGLRTGDKIYKIDGQETTEMSLNEAVSLIRGPAGTNVVLTVFRDNNGDMDELDIEITRDKIHFKTVKSEIKPGNILYIEVSHFNNDTEELFNEVVSNNISKDLNGIVLDLRSNPGGFLDVAVNMAGKWVRKGDVVVIERFSETQETPYRSSGRAEFAGIPTIVLVNGGSASASEIVAGALQDYELGTILGAQTFGKGSVQDLRELSDGSQIKITVAKWLTPEKRIIEGEGIVPDIEVERTTEDYDNDIDKQLDEALKMLKK
jgi:carboxyl-terminal processing protease